MSSSKRIPNVSSKNEIYTKNIKLTLAQLDRVYFKMAGCKFALKKSRLNIFKENETFT